MSIYDQGFYHSKYTDMGRSSARAVLPTVLEVTRATSIIDVGCGNGAWLAAALEAGVETVQGIDGPWIDEAWLDFPRQHFQTADLSQSFPSLKRGFDLAVCLEVGEHLPPQRATALTQWLTQVAPAVLFSAAVPGQGGTGHVNERWQSSWVEDFARFGLEPVGDLRATFWQSDDVAWYYRQNMLLFVAEGSPAANAPSASPRAQLPHDVVHPAMWDLKRNEHPVVQALKALAGRDRVDRLRPWVSRLLGRDDGVDVRP